jgi:hypothetical protein
LAFAAIFIYLGYRWRWTGFGEAALRRDERWEIRPIATVKSIGPAAYMDQAAIDYVLAVRVLHADSVIMTHAVVGRSGIGWVS